MLEIYHKATKACYIDEEGRDHEIDVLSIGRYIAEAKYTVKLEGMEEHFREITETVTSKPHTVHVYISPKNAKSFPMHTDPYDVFIYCLEGIKTMRIEKALISISEGNYTRIKANTPHRALNWYDSVMLSIGIEDAS